MGKLAEKMKKAMTKAKAKVAKKLGKNARECAKSACVVLAMSALMVGCATTGEQPARSQTMTVNLDECTITINLPQGAEGLAPTLELMTQTQANEGSETISPTATPTLDIKPDINLHYNDALKNATDASKSVLDTLTTAGANAVLKMMSDKSTGAVQVQKKDGTTAKVKCEDGQCSFCTDC